MAIHANSTPVPARPLLGPAASLGRLLASYPVVQAQAGLSRSRAITRATAARRSELLAILDAGPISPAEIGHLSRQKRRQAEDGIAALIALLDAIEPDCDLEDGGDTEPNCGDFGTYGANDECEDDRADDEPSFGATCFGSNWQDLWSRGDRRDLEEECEDEGACIQSQAHDAEPDEHSLGSLDRIMDQERWAEGGCPWGGADLELEDEHGGDILDQPEAVYA